MLISQRLETILTYVKAIDPVSVCAVEAEEREPLLARAYQLFNARDVDALLTMMIEDVEWPDVLNNAVLRGHEAVRAYWIGQFAVARPQVIPTEFIVVGDDVVAVISQQVFDLAGNALAPAATVFHRYSFEGDLVQRMKVFNDRDTAIASSS